MVTRASVVVYSYIYNLYICLFSKSALKDLLKDAMTEFVGVQFSLMQLTMFYSNLKSPFIFTSVFIFTFIFIFVFVFICIFIFHFIFTSVFILTFICTSIFISTFVFLCIFLVTFSIEFPLLLSRLQMLFLVIVIVPLSSMALIVSILTVSLTHSERPYIFTKCFPGSLATLAYWCLFT